MHRDGLGADEQLLADLAVGAALGHQRQDLALARGQRVGAGVGAGGRGPDARAARRAAAARRAGGRPRGPGRPARGPRPGRRSRAGCRPARVRDRASSCTWPKSSKSAAASRQVSTSTSSGGASMPASQRSRSISASSRFIHARPSGPQKPGRVGVPVEHGVPVGVQPLDVDERTPPARPPTATASPRRERRARPRPAGCGR